jgi:hypothetical protein
VVLLLLLFVLQVALHWRQGGPQDNILVNHMTMPGREKRVYLPSERTWP